MTSARSERLLREAMDYPGASKPPGWGRRVREFLRSPPPPWATDRCAECGGTEGLVTHDVTKHPPLCPECVDLWYPVNSGIGETEYLGP